MKKNSIKNKPDFPIIATIKGDVIHTTKSFNPGKLIHVMIPSKVEMDHYNIWHENYETFRRIKHVISENMNKADTEEKHEAYKKELQLHEQTFRPAPSIHKWTKIRARVIKQLDAGSLIEPAYPKDLKIVTQMGY